MTRAKLSSKNQIVIPRAARKAPRVKAGDTIEIVVRDPMLLLFPKPESYEAAIRGLARGLYPQEYLDKEPPAHSGYPASSDCGAIGSAGPYFER